MGSALGANWVAGGLTVRTCLSGRSQRTRSLASAARSRGRRFAAGRRPVRRRRVGRAARISPRGRAGHRGRGRKGRGDSGRRRSERSRAGDPRRDRRGAGRTRNWWTARSRVVHPRADRSTRVYLSGPPAAALAGLPAPWLDVVVLPGGLGAASALKMCTASMYQGHQRPDRPGDGDREAVRGARGVPRRRHPPVAGRRTRLAPRRGPGDPPSRRASQVR